MTSAEAKDEATLNTSIDHLARVEVTVDKIKSDLAKKHPDYMADLQNWYPSDKVQQNYHFGFISTFSQDKFARLA